MRGNWHDIVSDEISVITGRYAADIDGALEEAVVDIGVTSVYHHVVVVAKGLGAVEVQEHIAVGVLEEVTL